MAVVQTHGLTKRFGRLTAVDGLELTIHEGDRYGFLGLNGAGKTTTIRMALNLIRPSAGSISIFGKEIRSNFLEIMKSVGALVERPAYYPRLSGFRNVELMSRLSGVVDRRRVDEILEKVGLEEKAGARAHTYSHGMLQRLGIAMALVTRPRLAILDEPTNGLDPQGIIQIRELINELNRRDGTTFVISSHLLYEVELSCNRVGIIRRGRLVVEDTVANLLKQSGSGVRLLAAPAARARELLEKLDYVSDVQTLEGERGFRVSVSPDHFARLNRELVAAGLDVAEFSPVRPTLEDLFLRIQEAAA